MLLAFIIIMLFVFIIVFGLELMTVGRFVFLSVITVVGIFWCVFIGIGMPISDGDRTGVVTKFSHKGLMLKTWEGEMNMGGAISNGESGVVGNVWRFTVKDTSLVDDVQRALQSGKPVIMHYEELLAPSNMQGDTNYRIKSVKPQENLNK